MVAGQRLHTAILDSLRSFPHVIVLAATREFVACLLATSGSVVYWAFSHNQQGKNMSQLSKMLEEIKPKVSEATLEATNVMLDEALKLLTSEQLKALKNNVTLRFPDVDGPSNGDGVSVTYQLQALIKQIFSR
ncbi:hypothetical protein [Escherichia sp. E1130]|uniref:hypothetical protein n=2 Tax=Escherichia sp. E1130 TaxID=2041645 RepID=UPI00108204A7|nr:hypothetical protein [Escherichia sp. E1130]